jgi:hypothetical protein
MPDAGIACVPESSTCLASGNLQIRLDLKTKLDGPAGQGGTVSRRRIALPTAG